MGPHGLAMEEPWLAHGCAMELQRNPWNLKRIPWHGHGSETKFHGTLFKFHGTFLSSMEF